MNKSKIYLFIYTLAMTTALPIIFFRLFIKSLKSPNYRKRLPERLGFFSNPNFDNNKEVIWVHAVSVGETVASIPLIKAIQKNNPNSEVVVTTMTPTGSDTIKKLLKNSVFHVYLPYDIPFAINNFIKKIKPKKLIIMETEIWPNLIHVIAKNNIKIYIANARLSNKSKNGYKKISTLSKYILNCCTTIFAQYKNDANNFLELGVDNKKVVVTGNIKFDLETDENKLALGKKLKQQIGNKNVLIAASTHKGEDEIILDTFKNLKQKFSNLFLILVPRHPERFNTVANLIEKYNFYYARRSKCEIIKLEHDVLLGDTMGELMALYAASNIAFVGGSLTNIGGHNILEPASIGVPTITGHYLHNFKFISEKMNENNALVIVQSKNELQEQISKIIDNKKLQNNLINNSIKFFNFNKGAVNKIVSNL